jgi:uncharacterized protein DUF6089
MLGSLRYNILNSWLSIRTLIKNTVFVLILLGSSNCIAQNSEIGMEIGAYNYMGDLARKYDFNSHSFGTQFFYRKHLNDAFSTRLGVGFGSLKGEDNEAFDVFSANRSASFKSNFQNLDVLFEYHFLDFRNEKMQQRWTPYLSFGLGIYRSSGEDNFGNAYDTGVNLRIPIGMGIKYILNKRLILGFSTQVIKTYSDELDNVSKFNPNLKDYQGGNPNNDDIMFFTSFSISYTFYRIICPQGKWY